jgi:hypothetical protein
VQSFIGFIADDGSPLTVTKIDEIWPVGQYEIDSIIRKAGHNMDAIILDKSGHGRGQFGYRKLLYYKGFPEQSTPVFNFCLLFSKNKGERLQYYKRP